MAKKAEILLIAPSHLEAAISLIETRRANPMVLVQTKDAKGGAMVAGDMYDRAMTQFEGLTAMRVENGFAIVPLRGTVTQDEPFSEYYGETNLAQFRANFAKAMADSSVHSIVMNVNSPGGYIAGVEATSNMVFESRGKGKKIYAYTGSMAASAAYWIASAADEIILESETAQVGSIGVYLAAFDISALLAANGVKVTEITAGEFKAAGSPLHPMTDAEKAVLQEDVNFIYTRFVNTVARNRGKAVAEVLKSATGTTYFGTDALTRGLADSIKPMETLMTTPAANTNTGTQPIAATETEEYKAVKARTIASRPKPPPASKPRRRHAPPHSRRKSTPPSSPLTGATRRTPK
jgi:signal peptide peptidase SppA